ncbi:retrovirus-related pol polyprotein from transposon TNT 1-94 [Tanacetum coccineum]
MNSDCGTGSRGDNTVGNPHGFVIHRIEILKKYKKVTEKVDIKDRQNITCWNCNQKGHFQNQCSKLVASRDKEVNMAARDSDDALVCCIKNTVEDRIMDSCASFHATYCKEELERFKLCSDKTLKDVRYFPGLKRRLISVRRLDEEGYHIFFRDQQWKVTKGSLLVAHGNKRGSLHMVEVHPEGIGAIINGSCSAAVWFGEAEESFFHNVNEDKETAETAAGVANGIMMLKMVPETPLQFGVAKRLSRTFRAESAGIRAEAPKMLWAYSVSTAYLIYRIPYFSIGLRIPEEEWRGKDTSLAHLKDTKSHQVIRSSDITFVDSIYEARFATDSSSLTKPIQKSQVVLVDIPDNLVENDNIVAEHGLSSEITKSLGGSSDTSEGSENSRSFEDSGRSDEEYSKDEASFKEGGFKTPHERRSTRESRAPIRLPAEKKASQSLWMFRVKEKQDGSKRYKARLVVKGFQQKQRVDYNEIFSPVVKMSTISDVHQVGDEREVEVLRSFNWPPSELITDDGVLPERGYSQFNDVSSRYLVSKVS